jgi:hypothetical protein
MFRQSNLIASDSTSREFNTYFIKHNVNGKFSLMWESKNRVLFYVPLAVIAVHRARCK